MQRVGGIKSDNADESVRQKCMDKQDIPVQSIAVSDLRSCRMSLALNMVIRDVVAAGMMIIGVREPVKRNRGNIQHSMSLALNMVIRDVVAAGMMIIGVREPVKRNRGDIQHRMSLALNMVIRDVVAAGMMIIGVREPVKRNRGEIQHSMSLALNMAEMPTFGETK